ncbi:TonB-dependent receptor [Pedobacter nototheniae]|uniref:TonB-dependent receptor n=1 Tax=Pedobacter nototheniae TaxID=2488994 RepID=UPI00103BC0C3|nr:carboxypeptidase regulatory-like domain-containing protein [Pedobacter nototheniae]
MKGKILIATVLILFSIQGLYAQGVTTGNITGIVSDGKNSPIPGVTITAIHTSSGSRYRVGTAADGRFNILNVKVGGPYQIIASYLGYLPDTINNVEVTLGADLNVAITLSEATANLKEITVRSTLAGRIVKSGASLSIGKEQLAALPSISRSLSDFTRLVPQAGSAGMIGKGGKSNNLSIDGAAFNNSFGLGGDGNAIPGAFTGAQPISLDAIEQISVELSPYDVKQSGFTGAGINVVTKSGDNELKGSVYTFYRDENLIGQKTRDTKIPRTDFSETTYGFRLGGPIIKNKLFFFVNYENVKNTTPATSIIPARTGLSGDNIANIKADDLDALSSFLKTNYNYEAGQYENYKNEAKSNKFLIKLDWNINDKHKASLRYNQLNSDASLGGTNSKNTINFGNSRYKRNNNIYSITGELNSRLSDRSSNRIFASFTSLPDYRTYLGTPFPFVSINDNNNVYNFGTDRATKDNRVAQQNLQVQNDYTLILSGHKITTGLSVQYLNVSNSFTYTPLGAFGFNSVSSFYNSAPAGTVTPIGASTGLGLPSSYNLSYTLQENRSVTFSNPKILQGGFYLQDEISKIKNLSITPGIRVDLVSFLNKSTNNSDVETMSFQNAMGGEEKYRTANNPGTKILFSPRIGFNWNVLGNRLLQVRGGTGIFTGLIPFVYIEKTYGLNGLNEGNINATAPADVAHYPFSPDPNHYIPTDKKAPAQYELDLVSPQFKMPQTWRSTLAIDVALSSKTMFSIEALYSKDINAAYYRNANLNYNTATTDANGRLVYAQPRINNSITGAYVLNNTHLGKQLFLTASVTQKFNNHLSASLAYTHGIAKDAYSFRSTTPSSAFNAIPIVGNANIPVLSYSDFDLRHRFIGNLSYQINYAKDKLTTRIGLFFEGVQQGRGSYVYGGTGNVNNDQVAANDLIFIPAKQSDINLIDKTISGTLFTADQQWQALDNYINNSSYLKKYRGQYAQRNGVINPWYFRLDFKLAQDFSALIGKKKNTIELTVDILNFTNLLNKNWGYAKNFNNSQLITAESRNTFSVNPNNLGQGEFLYDTSLDSRYRIQFGVRYNFN